MTAGTLQDLFEPFPQLLSPERWTLYERIGRELLSSWDRVCATALRDGDAAPLHAVRDEYQSVLLAHLKLLDGYLTLARRADGSAESRNHTARVLASRDQLQKHCDSLFPRWKSLEDLEELLLESVSTPNDKLKEWASQNPPPQFWYDESTNPASTAE